MKRHIKCTIDELKGTRKCFNYNRLYLDNLKEMLEIKKNSKILDVGCGTGFFTNILAYQTNANIIGVDVDKNIISYAKKENRNSHIKYEEGDVYHLSFPDNTFDVVACHALLCNLNEPKKAIREMRRVAKKYVLAVEPCNNASIFYSNDTDYSKLMKIMKESNIKKEKEMLTKGVDLSIGKKVLSLFYEEGLNDARINIFYNIEILNKQSERGENMKYQPVSKDRNKNEELQILMKRLSNKLPPPGSFMAIPLFTVRGTKK